MKTNQKRKGYSVEQMNKRIEKYIKESAARLAIKLRMARKKSVSIKAR